MPLSEMSNLNQGIFNVTVNNYKVTKSLWDFKMHIAPDICFSLKDLV